MAPPSKLGIATSAVSRLLKEESTYHNEEAAQEARIQKLQDEKGDENKEFLLRQERQSLEQTKAIFGPLKIKIEDAVKDLEAQLADDGRDAPPEEISKAQEALTNARASISSERLDEKSTPEG